MMSEMTLSTSVEEIVRRHPSTRRVFDRHGLQGCGGENGPRESLDFFARVHQVDAQALLEELREEMAHPSPVPALYRASAADTIYRRFFKAGIAIVLSIGGLWGAVNLLDIALHKNFLLLNLVPAIHAHAHAMIFGWCGLFVMGFAYQSFPRFKHTTLWRPRLAVLTLYLMIAGILLRAAAELSVGHVPGPGLALGAAAAAAELAAIGLFILIIFRTARGSLEPHNPYEKFIFGALFWFFVSAVLSDIFFFAKATAASQQELIRRIALLDGPLRDVQLLGFVTLMIAGVSQRFLPLVYQLPRPRRDRQSLIFWLINASLLLDVACYVLMLTTGNPLFALGLEASFLMMLAWAVLLVRQLGIFARPGERDRSWKFVRGSYVWLLVAMVMLPLFPLYGLLTHQYFAHAYLGAYRHAFTVGFVTLMIMGVAARVVPILAGEDSSRLDALWGPFILLNAGNAGRVTLQILSDFFPGIAYSLVGVTGFLEVAALAWWGIELWRTMNRAATRRPALIQLPGVPAAS
jgi:NnrS protein